MESYGEGGRICMIPSAFAYERASSVQEAIELLRASDGEGKLIAGGHSLLPMMKLRLTSPGTLIDISGIEGLRAVKVMGDRLSVGALLTHYQIMTNPLVRERLPILAETASQIGDLQVRNRGTIGGNLAHADPASDLPAVALALDAQFQVMSAQGTETFSSEDFFLGPLITALPEDSILTSVSFHIPSAHARGAYEKFAHPASGYAVVGVAAVVTVSDGVVEDIRVAVTGAGDMPYRAQAVEEALTGKPLTREHIAAAAMFAAKDGMMADDLFASAQYRAHLCSVYVKRALLRVAGLNE